MTTPLQGRTIALAEGRQLEELAQMLDKEGATTLRCPMVSILDGDPDSMVRAARSAAEQARTNLRSEAPAGMRAKASSSVATSLRG